MERGGDPLSRRAGRRGGGTPAGRASRIRRRARCPRRAAGSAWSRSTCPTGASRARALRVQLAWLASLRAMVAAGPEATVVCGDMNIAPTDDDVFDPDAFIGQTHVTRPSARRWPSCRRSACMTSCGIGGPTSGCSPTGTTGPGCSIRISGCGSISSWRARRSPTACRRRGWTGRPARAAGRAITRRSSSTWTRRRTGTWTGRPAALRSGGQAGSVKLPAGAVGQCRGRRRPGARARRARGADHQPRQGAVRRARRDEARPRALLRRGRRAADARDGRPAGAHAALPAGRRRPVVLPEARARQRAGVAADDDRRRPSTARRRERWWRPTSRTSRGRSTSAAWASTSGRTAPTTPTHADELRLDLDPQPGTGFAEVRAAARELKALLDELGIAGFPKTTGNRGLHVYVRLQPRWDSYEVRSAAVAAARELERRRPDILTAAWWKEERGRADLRRLQPERAAQDGVRRLVGARPRGRAGLDAVPLGGARRGRPRRADAGDASRPAGARRRSVGGDRRRAAVARAAAGAARARPRERPARRAVAAGLSQAARRAAARRAEPRPPESKPPEASERPRGPVDL